MTPGPDPFADPREVARMYHDDGLEQSDIAERFGVHQSTVSKLMKREGIETRDESDTHSTPWATFVRATTAGGYERWDANHRGTTESVYVHRLAAVAWFGLDAVTDRVVHHKNGVPWDNRESNIELLTSEEHGAIHGADARSG